MAQNAENFGTNRVVLDPGGFTDGVLTVFVKGESEPRLVIDIDGTILAGDGVTPPEAAAAAPSTSISKVNGGDFAAATTTSSAGNSTVTGVASGAASGAANLEALSGAGQAVVFLGANVDGSATGSMQLNNRHVVNASDDGDVLSLAFYDATPVAQQTLASTTALPSDIVTALAALGLVIDSDA